MNTEETVTAAVSDLRLGSRFTLAHLLQAIQERRHRRLRVVELADLDTRDGICALWLVTDTEDFVLHARSDSALHRDAPTRHSRDVDTEPLVCFHVSQLARCRKPPKYSAS